MGQTKDVYSVNRYYVDKQLGNIYNLGLLATIFPQAKFIYTRRNKMDTCLSCYQQVFTSVPFSSNLDDLGKKYENVELLMEHWQSLLPERIYTLDYEVLVGEFEPELKRLTDFLQLEWQAEILNFHLGERSVVTASSQQVKKPVYSHSVDKWQRYSSLLKPIPS